MGAHPPSMDGAFFPEAWNQGCLHFICPSLNRLCTSFSNNRGTIFENSSSRVACFQMAHSFWRNTNIFSAVIQAVTFSSPIVGSHQQSLKGSRFHSPSQKKSISRIARFHFFRQLLDPKCVGCKTVLKASHDCEQRFGDIDHHRAGLRPQRSTTVFVRFLGGWKRRTKKTKGKKHGKVGRPGRPRKNKQQPWEF